MYITTLYANARKIITYLFKDSNNVVVLITGAQ